MLVRECRIEPSEIARFLQLTAPAFDRCLRQDRFTRDQRAKLLRLSAVLDRAQRVLGDRARAIGWLTSANRALGFSAPLGLIESRSGTQRVYGVLQRIEQGHFA